MEHQQGQKDCSALELVRSISKSVYDTKRIVKEVPVSKSNFLMLAFYLGELHPLLEDLGKEDQQLLNSFPMWTALNRIEGIANEMQHFAKVCTSRSRIFLLYKIEALLEKIRRLVKDLAHSLSAIPEGLPTVLRDGFVDLAKKLETAGFYKEPYQQEVADEIFEGLAAHHVDEPFATCLLKRIADNLAVPLPAAAELKLELQRDLESAELEEDHPNLQDLRALCELLSPAAVLADVRRLAVEENGVAGYGSLSLNSSFICPITGQVMRDPVMLVEAGFTYEREAICEWFDRGHRTCPDTGQELQSLDLVPNYNLRQAIEEFSDRSSRRALTDAIDRIREKENGSFEENEIEEAVETIKSLSDTNPKYKRLIASMDGIQPLVGILKKQKEKMPTVWDRVLKLLVSIAAIGDEYRILVKKAGVIPTVVRHLWRYDGENIIAMQMLHEISMVEEGVSEIIESEKSLVCIAQATNAQPLELRSVAHSILNNLCKGHPEVAVSAARYQVFGPLVTMLSREYSLDIRVGMARAVVDLKLHEEGYTSLVNTGVIQPLLDLLSENGRDEKCAAAKALQHLSNLESSKVTICKAGAIPALVHFLSSEDQDLRLAVMGTLANLATDHQGAMEIDQQGAVLRLLSMLKLDLHTLVHEYALKTLQCMAKESKTVRSSVKEFNEGPYLVTLLQAENLSASSRASILNLLSHLADDRETRNCFALSDEDVRLLIEFLNQPIDPEEQEAIFGIFCGQSKLPQRRDLLVTPMVLETLVKFLDCGTMKAQENAALALSKILESDLATSGDYQFVAKQGAMTTLNRIVTGGSLHGKLSAAVVLGILSKSTPTLTEKLTYGQKVAGFLGVKKFKLCKVHAGKCNPKKTLCLIESGSAACLLILLKEKEPRTAEKAVEALSTLIENDDNRVKGLWYLVKNDAISALIGAIGKSPSLTEKAVQLLEQIFRDRRFRDEKYWNGAQSSLRVVLSTGQAGARRAAAMALEHLGLFPKGSSYTV